MKVFNKVFILMVILIMTLNIAMLSSKSFARVDDGSGRNSKQTSTNNRKTFSSVGKSIASQSKKIVKKATNNAKNTSSKSNNKKTSSSVGKSVASQSKKIVKKATNKAIKTNKDRAKKLIRKSNLSKKDKKNYQKQIDKASTIKEIKNILNKHVKKSINKNNSTLEKKINNTCDFAEKIANDNAYTYGKKPYTSHYGCPICGKTHNKVNLAKADGETAPEGKSYENTFNCVTFINSAIAHGTKDPVFMDSCKSGKSVLSGKNNPEQSIKNSKGRLKNVGKPKSHT